MVRKLKQSHISYNPSRTGWIWIDGINALSSMGDWICQKCGYEDEGATPIFIKECPSCHQISHGSKYSGFYLQYESFKEAHKNCMEHQNGT